VKNNVIFMCVDSVTCVVHCSNICLDGRHLCTLNVENVVAALPDPSAVETSVFPYGSVLGSLHKETLTSQSLETSSSSLR
jgi:hypothetical protein